MRFNSVLIFNNLTNSISFQFKNLFAMRDIQASDFDHIGHVTKCLFFSLVGMHSFKIPFTDYNLLLDRSSGNLGIVEHSISDFTLGVCIAVPTTFTLMYAFQKLPMKPYLIMGLCSWYILST